MGVKEDFEFNAEANGEPVQSAKDGGDVLFWTYWSLCKLLPGIPMKSALQ